MSALPSPAAEIARRLSSHVEAVCRHYLSNGRRCGHYWIVGDVSNNPGRSLYIRLRGPSSGKGAAGKWSDGATAEHGDLLDLIRLACGFDTPPRDPGRGSALSEQASPGAASKPAP